MHHLLDENQVCLEILEHSVSILSHHFLELTNVNLVHFHGEGPDVHLVKGNCLQDLDSMSSSASHLSSRIYHYYCFLLWLGRQNLDIHGLGYKPEVPMTRNQSQPRQPRAALYVAL